jgi:ribonuclease J
MEQQQQLPTSTGFDPSKRPPRERGRRPGPAGGAGKAAGPRGRGGNQRRGGNGDRRGSKIVHEEGKARERRPDAVIPPPGENLRIIPIGGVEEIGKNMTLLEYGDDIIVIDAGLQFSEADTPGIDFIIPNVKYLEENKKKVKALFITHGHLDHIGGIPYIMDRIGNPPIYSRQFGAALILKRQVEYPDAPQIDMRVLEGTETIKVGENFKVETFDISHAIPDSMGLVVHTPVGDVAFISDVRVDHLEGVPSQKEIEHYKALKNKDFLLFTLESTRIEKPGFSIPESAVIKTIDGIMKNAGGRVIIGTFASQVERIVQFIELAEKYNKKIVIEGRSMKTNVEIAKELGLLKINNILPIEEIDTVPPHKIIIIGTGGQGEPYSMLDRIANKTHRFIRLSKSDTVVLSSSEIPGNEFSIGKLKDNLYRQEAKVITYLDSDVHAGGHGYRGELEWIHKQVSYKYFMPVHGNHYMLRIHGELAQSLGVPEANIVIPDDGSVIEFAPDGTLVRRKEKAPADPVMVDGLSVGDVQDVVIKDRQMLAQDGIFFVVVSLNSKTKKLKKSPDILSRGFVYVRESQELLGQTRFIIKKTVEELAANMNPINFDYIKDAVTEKVRQFLFQETGKRPIVLPVILGV